MCQRSRQFPTGLAPAGWLVFHAERVLSAFSRRPAGLAASLAIHALFIVALLAQWGTSPYGIVGPDAGNGMRVSLVDGLAAGGLQVGANMALDGDFSTDSAAADLEVLSANGPMDPVAAPLLDAAREAEQEASLEFGTGGRAAGVFEDAQGSRDGQGGDPSSATDLLEQIARCLPPNLRPRLGFSNLVLEIGDRGVLRAAPEVVSALPRLSAEDRLAADRIVQAALLCGPYDKPGVLNRAISLVADFSSIQPSAPARIADALPGRPSTDR